MPPRPNVAVVECDSSDGITITLVGRRLPPGMAPRHEFKGQSLKQIDSIMLDLGVHVLAWMVARLPWHEECDLPLVEVGYAQYPKKPSDKPLVFSP